MPACDAACASAAKSSDARPWAAGADADAGAGTNRLAGAAIGYRENRIWYVPPCVVQVAVRPSADTRGAMHSGQNSSMAIPI